MEKEVTERKTGREGGGSRARKRVRWAAGSRRGRQEKHIQRPGRSSGSENSLSVGICSDLLIFVFSARLSLCPQSWRGPPALTVHSRGWEVGGPEGPDGGGSLPARGQHLHLQTVEGGRPQTWHREHGAILRGDRRGRAR